MIEQAPLSNIVPFDQWLKELSLDRSTGYRYRKAGIVSAIEVFGRLYITREEIARFEARAGAGDFSRKPGIVKDPPQSELARSK